MPATAAPPRTADFIIPPLRRAIAYGELLVKDIPADQFAHMPHPTMNHPAFNIGHLSLYPNRVFTLLGQPKGVVEKPGYSGLFQAGVQCVEQDGRYPHKDEIVGNYLERYNTIATVLADVSDETFQHENPLEGRLKELFPFVGSAVNFLLIGHHMSHLGQISAWRRAVGLPSVF
jgi:hypothetical protein